MDGRALPTGPVSGGRSVPSSIAWTSTCLAPGVRAWWAGHSTLEYGRRHTGETRCPATKTAHSTAFAREVLVGPHRARTVASSSRAMSREPMSTSSTPHVAMARVSKPMATSRMRNVGRHPTGRRMAAPRANRSYSTGPVPLSGSRRTPTPSCFNSRANGIGTPCKATGSACRSLIRHELDFSALACYPMCASQTAVWSTTACQSGITCAPGPGSSVMAGVFRIPQGAYVLAPRALRLQAR